MLEADLGVEAFDAMLGSAMVGAVHLLNDSADG